MLNIFIFQIKLDVCIFVGLSILQYSKLHMNRYHYECLDRLVLNIITLK